MSLSAQQKANDFTKRVGILEGKQSSLSGRFFNPGKLSNAFNRRIKIEEWPSKFSPFGGKRFTTNDIQGLIQKRVPFPENIDIDPARVPGVVIEENKRAKGLHHTNRYTSSASVDFRDAYYAKLNRRMDEWMEKVNNLSLRDINRFQFREGRPAEPGFPVQRAGSGGSSSGIPSSSRSSNLPDMPSKYWLGPRTISSKTGVSKGHPSNLSSQKKPKSDLEPKSNLQQKSRASVPVPRLGPKKIRIEIK